MKRIRATHRMVTLFIVIVTTYLAFTGTAIQVIDLHSILTKAPAEDPNVEAMREDHYGPGSYAVLSAKDFSAPPLPQGADLQGMLARTVESARITAGQVPLDYVELRMAEGQPVGVVSVRGRLAQFDAQTGHIISSGPPPAPKGPPVSQFHQSPRNMFKVLHRMTLFGNYALFINVLVAIGLFVMIGTGIVMYFKILGARRKVGMPNPFWEGGGSWKTWHRRVSILAAVFLTVVAFSGLWLAYESLYFGFYMGSAKQRAVNTAFAAHMAEVNPPKPPMRRLDPMSPEAEPVRLASMKHDIGLTDDELATVKPITDDFVRQNTELLKSGDPQSHQKAGALHPVEANRILAVLKPEERPRFLAWREAQLLGLPLPGARGGGQTSTVPLNDAQLPSMLATTLSGFHTSVGDTSIRVVRLRDFAGIPQGVIVTGVGEPDQFVFNAKTAAVMSETEPGYPPVGFPFGWQAHQLGKSIHRGSIIGLPGRLMDLFAGLALFYLSIGGIVMYANSVLSERRVRRLAAERHSAKGITS